MNVDHCVRALSLPLPEDIEKRKWAGDLAGAIRAIDARLKEDLPEMLRDRLLCEKERIRRLPTQYPWKRPEALKKLQELVPDVTEAELDQLEDEGKVDYIYLNGEKHYFVRFHRSLYKTLALKGHESNKPNPVSTWLDPMIKTIKEQGKLSRRITLETSIHCPKEGFVPGEYRAWLPFPAECAQQSDIRLISGDPDQIAEASAPARTAYWQRELKAWDEFRMRYSYVSTIRYADPLHAPAPDAPLYPDALPVCAADTEEEPPFLCKTPYLRSLAESLSAGKETPVEKAWAFYEFATTKVNYAFMRDYFQIDHLGEYCAVNGRGDCGLQALLFINLCRCAGIPARWQSGMSIDEDYVGSHDWTQFYLEGWGWLFADPSYGGGAWRNGNKERHAFYFGNIDPMRLVANRIYQAPLTPESHAFRVDPYDNQSGELERVGAEYSFTGRDLDGDAIMTAFEDL